MYEQFKAKVENEWLIVVRSRCRQNLKFSDFTSLLCRGTHEYLLKCVLHVQHDYFPPFTNNSCDYTHLGFEAVRTVNGLGLV